MQPLNTQIQKPWQDLSNLLEKQELHKENLAEKETQHRELKGQNKHISMTLIEAENYKGQNLI